MAQQLTHKSVWKALDKLANQQGLTPSGLARCAGLNATTFNPSKRRAQGGRQRWPSTESIAKVLEATGTGVEEFFSLLDEGKATKTNREFP
jgi:phage repressor protein C with HTH and peptisase S24 domain